MKTSDNSARKSSLPFGLIAVYALGLALIALNLKNFLIN